MKISLNWLREYVDLDMDAEQIAEILTEIGLEVEGYEEVEQIKGSLKDLVVGEVTTCVKHPNADRLWLTTVDIGQVTLQIVCGAPNVGTGQRVVVAPVGTTLYSHDGAPWQINRGKIRGEVSEGMICAVDEIGLGTDHSGILVLDDTFVIGNALASYYDTATDTVFEIGLTPNRSDATCHLGVARDLFAALKINYGHKGQVKLPALDAWQVDNDTMPIQVEVLDTEGCPRYAGVSISNVSVKESPGWLKNRLKMIGLRPINNIVDATNYVLHELGQPLHAFDIDKIDGRAIKVQTLPKGSAFVSLDEQVRKLHEEDLMICDGHDNGMCIAGVFGGLGSGVTNQTHNIFLESAHFNAKWIRRTSGRYLLFTDAAKVFEKGSDPNICVFALKRAALLIQDLAGGQIASEIVDIYSKPVKPNLVSLDYGQLNRLVGANIHPKEVEQILLALEMKIQASTPDSVTVAVPTNKVDVTRQADLIEEVLRIYGFNRVPDKNRMSFSVSNSHGIDEARLRNLAADYLSAHGFHEIMGLSMIDKRYVERKEFQLNDVEMVRINNTSNVQIEVMRPNLLVTTLETISYNQNRQQNDLRLYEFGKSYLHVAGQYQEKDHLTLAISGWHQESWLTTPLSPKNEYYVMKGMVENLLSLYGIGSLEEEVVEDAYWNFALKYSIDNQQLAVFGQVNDDLLSYLDIRGAVFYSDFDWSRLIRNQKVDQIQVKESSRFPVVRRDLALIIQEEVPFSAVRAVIARKLGLVLKGINLFDVYRNEEILGSGQKSYAVSLLLSDSTKTFSDKEVDQMIVSMMDELTREVGARLR
ncbi:MAG: phenylalanine--tRNA ligase subunit beta [Saprospiraceae bacterium]|nr:phenylalanine--tRNA ligase subunit beta [Saprospiraceae bacterium]